MQEGKYSRIVEVHQPLVNLLVRARRLSQEGYKALQELIEKFELQRGKTLETILQLRILQRAATWIQYEDPEVLERCWEEFKSKDLAKYGVTFTYFVLDHVSIPANGFKHFASLIENTYVHKLIQGKHYVKKRNGLVLSEEGVVALLTMVASNPDIKLKQSAYDVLQAYMPGQFSRQAGDLVR